MTRFQRNVVVLATLSLLAMVLFPPFVLKVPQGLVIDMGYDWLFSPPNKNHYSASVNIVQLAMQFGAVTLMAVLLIFLNYSRTSSNSSSTNHGESNTVPSTEKAKAAKDLSGIGGWLLFLCLGLTIIGPIINTGRLISSYEAISPQFLVYHRLETAVRLDMMVWGAIIVFGVFCGIFLWNKNEGSVGLAKVYFVSNAVWALVEPFIFGWVGELPNNAVVAMVADPEFIGATIGQLLGASIWYMYLSRSKRVRATYFPGQMS